MRRATTGMTIRIPRTIEAGGGPSHVSVSLLEMEGKEDAQKVLKCMYCGHSFESLQDLSVHMIKTKHYQKVPLKEPIPALTSKLVPPTKKRAFQDLMSPSSPESVSSGILLGESPKDQKVGNPYVTPNNRYGYPKRRQLHLAV